MKMKNCIPKLYPKQIEDQIQITNSHINNKQ